MSVCVCVCVRAHGCVCTPSRDCKLAVLSHWLMGICATAKTWCCCFCRCVKSCQLLMQCVCLSAWLSQMLIWTGLCIHGVERSREGCAVCSALLWPVYVWRGEAIAEAEAGHRGHSGSVRAGTLSKPCWSASHNTTDEELICVVGKNVYHGCWFHITLNWNEV